MARHSSHRGDLASDAIRRAWISGTTSRYAGWRMPTGAKLAEGLAEVRADATDHTGHLRADLLGQEAGLHQGLAIGHQLRDNDLQGQGYACRARFVVAAGADLEEMAAWLPIGIARSKPNGPRL